MLPRVNIVRSQMADFLLLSTRDALSMELYDHGDYAAILKAVALAVCKEDERPFLMDIGANLGAFSVPIAKEIEKYGGSVFAYEPQRIVFYQLCGNIFLNRLENCHAMHLALGSMDGTIEIPELDYEKSPNIGGYSLNKDINLSFPYVLTTNKSHFVQMIKLDSIIIPKSPVLMKIDVEGYELDVLQGGTQFLKTHGYPFLMLECWQADWYAERRKIVLSCLDTLGYNVFVFGEDLFAQHVTNTKFSFENHSAGGVKMMRIGL